MIAHYRLVTTPAGMLRFDAFGANK